MAGAEGPADGGGQMSVEERLKAALDVFGFPVERGLLYAEASKCPEKYYTFSIGRSGDDFADDEPGAELCRVSVHLFAPLAGNLNKQIRQTKRALSAAGFTWPSQTDATDATGQHYIFECETVEGIECDGEL